MLDFDELDFGRVFGSFGGWSHSALIKSGVKSRVERLYSEPGRRLRVTDDPFSVRPDEVVRRVKFMAPSWFYELNAFGAGVFPFVGTTAFVFADQAADLSFPGNVDDLIRTLGNTSAHEAAHSMGRWGHTSDGPWIMQEGVTGYTGEVYWDAYSRSWLGGVLGQP